MVILYFKAWKYDIPPAQDRVQPSPSHVSLMHFFYLTYLLPQSWEGAMYLLRPSPSPSFLTGRSLQCASLEHASTAQQGPGGTGGDWSLGLSSSGTGPQRNPGTTSYNLVYQEREALQQACSQLQAQVWPDTSFTG